jgi:hypothetical protein
MAERVGGQKRERKNEQEEQFPQWRSVGAWVTVRHDVGVVPRGELLPKAVFNCMRPVVVRWNRDTFER